ncbi:MAG TPA: nucleotidyltransferase family protein [Asticcacaulis sp.]|nr:nucleotidyltransferase family protein [Asticcacaulis sp.]
MQANEVALLIMAGGHSRRFGSDDKLLADLNGQKLGLRVAARFAELGWAEKLAVARAPLKSEFEALGYATIEPKAGNGLGDNLALGGQGLSDVSAVLVVLADMPFVTENHVAALLAAAGSTADAVCTRAGDVRSPPVLIGRDYFNDLRSLSGDAGARRLLDKAGANLVEIAGAAGIMADVDTVDDYMRWKATDADA